MLTSSCLAVVSSLLMAAPLEAAEPARFRCDALPESIVLDMGAAADSTVACVSMEQATVIEFESPFSAVTLEHGERFSPIPPGGVFLVMKPRTAMAPGERIAVSVTFDDGRLPAQVNFSVSFHPGHAHRQVKVFRQARPAAQVVLENQHLRAETARLQRQVEELTEQGRAASLVQALHSGVVAPTGVEVQELAPREWASQNSGLKAYDTLRFRSGDSVVLRVRVANRGTQPWHSTQARLTCGVKELDAVPFQPLPVEPGDSGLLYVQVTRVAGEAQCSWSLSLWSKEGRTLTLSGIAL